MLDIPDSMVAGDLSVEFNAAGRLYIQDVGHVRAAASNHFRYLDGGSELQPLGNRRRGIRFGGQLYVPRNPRAVQDLETLGEMESRVAEITFARNTLLSAVRRQHHHIAAVRSRIPRPYRGRGYVFIDWEVETEFRADPLEATRETLGAFTVTAPNVTSRAARLVWTASAVPGDVEGVVVSYTGTISSVGQVHNIPTTTELEVTQTGLEPGTLYVVQVVATADGYNPAVATVRFTTPLGTTGAIS